MAKAKVCSTAELSPPDRAVVDGKRTRGQKLAAAEKLLKLARADEKATIKQVQTVYPDLINDKGLFLEDIAAAEYDRQFEDATTPLFNLGEDEATPTAGIQQRVDLAEAEEVAAQTKADAKRVEEDNRRDEAEAKEAEKKQKAKAKAAKNKVVAAAKRAKEKKAKAKKAEAKEAAAKNKLAK